MDYIYAQINDENICVGISYLSGLISADNMIHIDEETAAVCMGRKYENENWIEAPMLNLPEPELSENEQAVMDTAVNVEYLVCVADMGF